MTPPKNQLSIWPADYELTTAVDLNYVADMVWDRAPQLRFTYRPSPAFTWAAPAEKPEQQIGTGVRLPACCTSDLQAQYNVGTNGLSVPNLMPDIVSRVAFNGAGLHLDVGGAFRVFRHTLKPFDDSFKPAGGGISLDARLMSSIPHVTH